MHETWISSKQNKKIWSRFCGKLLLSPPPPGGRNNTRETTAACNIFFNTYFFPFTNPPLRYRTANQMRFPCKQRAYQNGRHCRRQHADCRYLVVFLSSFSLLLALCAILNSVAVHLFSLLKCIYYLHRSVTNIAFLSTVDEKVYDTVLFMRLDCRLRDSFSVSSSKFCFSF